MTKYTPKRPPIQISDTITGIPLTQGHIALVDTIDADLGQFNWIALVAPHTIYARRTIIQNGERKVLRLHRVILERLLGRELLLDEYPDHWDCNGLNCCRSNLRVATKLENARNQRKHANNRSGYKGVAWNSYKGVWQVTIASNGHNIHLGYFHDILAAHAAYCEAALKYHGDFARFE